MRTKINGLQDEQYWLDQPGSPKPKLENEDGLAETISYDELLKSWDIGSDADEAKEGDFEEGESSSPRHVCEGMIIHATVIFTTLSLMQSVGEMIGVAEWHLFQQVEGNASIHSLSEKKKKKRSICRRCCMYTFLDISLV